MADATRSYIESDGDLYRFVLKKIHYTDSGTYTIKASNCYGTQKAYCAVRVSIDMFSTIN
jgi:Immunoglobulin I-set domain